MTATLATPREHFHARRDLPDDAELILGEIHLPVPEGPLHFSTTRSLAFVLGEIFGFRRVHAEARLPIPDDGEPRPDILVLREDIQAYGAAGHTSADALLVVEVIVSSSSPALFAKDLQYALGGIPEYWIVDPQAGVLEVRTEPGPRGYGRREAYRVGDEFRGIDLATFLIPPTA